MREAVGRACDHFEVTWQPDSLIWGWQCRNANLPVGEGLWLRMSSVIGGKNARFQATWDGPATADAAMPAGVPRPRLLDSEEWTQDGYYYRAEVYQRAANGSLSTSRRPPDGLELPTYWWTSLRSSLNAISRVRTDRYRIRPDYLRFIMPLHLGTSISTQTRWAAAHGDLVWSNIGGPRLYFFDWEYWGLAPVGFDAAVLYTSALDNPEVARRVWAAFQTLFESPEGRFALLAACAIWLERVSEDMFPELEEPLRSLVGRLLP